MVASLRHFIEQVTGFLETVIGEEIEEMGVIESEF